MSSDSVPDSNAHGPVRSPIDATRPNIARVYDYLLGGKDHYAPDRDLAGSLEEALPEVVTLAHNNRRFMERAVRYLAGEAGIGQFLDIGAGLPTAHNTHELAAGARVAYVDNDPAVVVHGQAILASGTSTFVAADLRDPGEVLRASEGLIDFGQPVGILLGSILHFLGDADDPSRSVAWLRDAVAPGSHLVLTHVERHEDLDAAAELYRAAMGQGTRRSRQEIAAFFDGFDLLEPGLVGITDWRPAISQEPTVGPVARFLGGVARKPGQGA